MTSQQVANYLNQLGSNQRKLQYCRQILAEHPHFTAQEVFNINSKTPTNTLYRSQFVELLKSIGVEEREAQVLRVFEYFQVDGKNYVTLEQFSGLMLPQTDNGKKMTQNLKEKKLVLDYSLKFSLQKFFKQVLENQTKAEQLSCFTLEQKQGSKLKYRKIDPLNIKNFLAAHGKYPTESVIESIHKEISLNKGSSKRNKSIVDYVLQYNDKKGNNIQKAQNQSKEVVPQSEGRKIALNEQKQGKDRALTARPAQQRNTLQQNQRISSKVLCDISLGVNNKSITRQASFKVANSNTQTNNVDSRIKTLMNSINIKPSLQRTISKHEKIQEKENRKNSGSRVTIQSKPDQSFSRVSIPEKVSARKAITDRLATMNIYLNEEKKEFNIPRTAYLTKTALIVEEQHKETPTVIRTRARTPTFSENRKENSSVLSGSKPTEKARRLEYLKSLVDQDSSKHGVQTFRS